MPSNATAHRRDLHIRRRRRLVLAATAAWLTATGCGAERAATAPAQPAVTASGAASVHSTAATQPTPTSVDAAVDGAVPGAGITLGGIGEAAPPVALPAPVSVPSGIAAPALPAPPATAAPSQPAGDGAGTVAPDGVLALLASLPVVVERRVGYDRGLFEHWVDGDGDGCDTRDEVLIVESLEPAQVDPYGCQVMAGRWYSAYDGLDTNDPGELHIDHVVALAEAWDSGAWAWDADRRRAFANDLDDARSLVAVSARSNTAKSDKDPADWLPRPDAVCAYLSDWVSIKVRWSLSVDAREQGAIAAGLARCGDTAGAPGPAPTAVPGTGPVVDTPVTVAPAPWGGPTSAPTPFDGDDALDPMFRSCAAAKQAGYGPYRSGVDVEYDWYRDGDGDGVACE